jgi:carotenoid 1,2-hydratase
VDALSDDLRHGLTVIAFVGSVFSPYYAWARRRGSADPEQFCALNVALYGPRGGKRWALTERRRASLHRDSATLAIGPSALAWDGSALTIRIDEVTVPLPRRLRGTLRVLPAGLTGHTVPLDAAGRHRWSPLAPVGRVEVAMDSPALRWSGHAYLDANHGDAPLEADFARWDWSRADLADGGAALLYDVTRLDGSERSLALRVDARGALQSFAPPPPAALPATRWRVRRATRANGAASVRRTLEDTPFYARSVLDSRLLGEDVVALHESLSLDRFRNPLVQLMLPFRMPRARR